MLLEGLEQRTLLAVLTVTSPDDTIADDGLLTLREAINEANADSNTDTIAFNINGGGAQTITLDEALPVIKETVTIDGSTQPEANGTSLITIDASAVTAFAVMDVRFEAGGSELRNFNIAIDNVSTTALYVRAENGSVLAENLNLSGEGGGIQLLRDGNVVRGVTASNSGVAIWIIAAGDNQVEHNDLRDSGTGVAVSGAGSGNAIIGNNFSDTEVGIEARAITSLFVMKENVFTGSGTALTFWDLDNIDLIASSDFDIDVTDALTGMGLFNASNVTIDGFDLSSTGATPTGEGLRMVGGDNNLVRNVVVQNRTTGIVLSATSNVSASCSRILANGVGVAVSGVATTGLILNDNQIQGNTQYGISNARESMVNAEHNYWGASDGPSNLGGPGDSYFGNVDADPYRESLPECLLPVIDTFTSSSPSCGGAVEGETVSVSATFRSPIIGTAHAATIDWGDNSTTAGTVTQDDGSGTVSGTHAYTNGGIYTVTITLTGDHSPGVQAETVTVIAGVGVHDGVLQVVGTDSGDNVTINKQDDSRYRVVANFLPQNKTISMTEVTGIYVLLCGGNDQATVAGDITTPVRLDGGDGNDKLKGGAGHDVLLGGAGDDLLVGRHGRDLLVGGRGADRLIGNPDDDILIAGYLAFANVDQAITAIMAEWKSDDRDFSTRLANVSGTGTGTRENGVYFLTADGSDATVVDDDARDILTGSAGEDWFFANLEGGVLDKITDLNDEELATDLAWILAS
jgi:Ca2+-binding RTX toxin-like protein